MEAKLQNSLYKIELHCIKIIPILIAINSFTDTILSYCGIEGNILSYINGLLVWLFLYLSSFVFKFCSYHRMFLYYILVIGIINVIDYEIGIPLGFRDMVGLQLILAGIFIFTTLYLYKHDKLPRKGNCGKPAD